MEENEKVIFLIILSIFCFQKVYAEEINWESVKEQALQNSFDLKIPETSVLSEKIKLAEINNELQKTKNEFEKSLKELSFLTRIDYEKNTEIKDFIYENIDR